MGVKDEFSIPRNQTVEYRIKKKMNVVTTYFPWSQFITSIYFALLFYLGVFCLSVVAGHKKCNE